MVRSLALLAQYDRPDCSFEQIVVDFPKEFDLDLVTKARTSLAVSKPNWRLNPFRQGKPTLVHPAGRSRSS